VAAFPMHVKIGALARLWGDVLTVNAYQAPRREVGRNRVSAKGPEGLEYGEYTIDEDSVFYAFTIFTRP